jgi:hypothetical protein
MPELRLFVATAAALVAAAMASAQTAKPTTASKATKGAKSTKAIPPVAFEAHNEGSIEGAIYGAENLVTVTIDSSGIHYLGKGSKDPVSIPWDQVSDWQPNNFTSRSPSRTTEGDYGIGIHQGARYFSFRTRNGRDYLAAIKALRAHAAAKEHPGIG